MPGVQRLRADAGMNLFLWNMRYPGADRVPGAILWGGNLSGPAAVPGKYQVRIQVGNKEMTQEWEWKKDPRISTTQQDFQDQFDLLIQIRDKVTEVNQSIIQLRDVKEQINDLLQKAQKTKADEEIEGRGKEILKKLIAVEDVLIQSKSKSGQDPLNYPIMLDNKIAALASVVAHADARPTDQSYEVFQYLSAKAGEQLEILKGIFDEDIPAFNKIIQESGIPAIVMEKKKK
jgi:hypothetical protein